MNLNSAYYFAFFDIPTEFLGIGIFFCLFSTLFGSYTSKKENACINELKIVIYFRLSVFHFLNEIKITGREALFSIGIIIWTICAL
jgi:hypothetical protein